MQGLRRLIRDLTRTKQQVLDALNVGSIKKDPLSGVSVIEAATTGAQYAVAELPRAVPQLDPVNWYSDFLQNADANYLYGWPSTRSKDFLRINKATRARTVVSAPWGLTGSESLRAIVVTSIAGVILACTGDSSILTSAGFKVWRSADYGDTWSLVLTLGSNQTPAGLGIWMLSHRNFCESVSGAWYIGEYNVYSSRVNGGNYDGVTIWKSVDRGLSWIPQMVFNTAGQHQIRHIHIMKTCPDNGKIFISCGDTGAEAATFIWDEVTNLAVDFATLPSTMVVYNAQKARVTDMLFPGDGYMYSAADSASTAVPGFAADVGLFKTKVDGSNWFTRLNSAVNVYNTRDLIWAALMSSGEMLWMEETTATPSAGQFNFGIWATNRDRTAMARVGKVQMGTNKTGGSTPSLFQDGNNVYMASAGYFLGKGVTTGTCVFTVSSDKAFNGIREDAVHPVYWIDPVNGVDNTDTERGYRPDLPWATLKYCLENSKVVQGGRLMFPAGLAYTENPGSLVDCAIDTANAETTEYLCIEGRGKNATKFGLAAGSALAAHIQLKTNITRLEVKDMQMTTYRATSQQAILATNNNTNAQAIRIIRARIGGRDVGVTIDPFSLGISGGGTVDLKTYDSEICCGAYISGTAPKIFTQAAGGVSVESYRTVWDGQGYTMIMQGTNTWYGENNLHCGFSTGGVFTLAASATSIPRERNSAFATEFGQPIIVNSSSLIPSGEFVNCAFSQPIGALGIFDVNSYQDPGVWPKDPVKFDFSRSAGPAIVPVKQVTFSGMFVSATVAAGSAVSLTTATAKTITSISLPPGDWDVAGAVDFVAASATTTLFRSGVSLAADTLPTQPGGSGLGTDALATDPLAYTTTSFTKQTRNMPVRLQLLVQTTVYLVAEATFSAGTMTAYGTIRARLANTAR